MVYRFDGTIADEHNPRSSANSATSPGKGALGCRAEIYGDSSNDPDRNVQRFTDLKRYAIGTKCRSSVDSKTSEPILEVLTQALNAGALVYVPDDDGQLILTSLRGKRFRLSYLLAPLYGFPVRLGKDVALSALLRSNANQVDDSRNGQLDLMSAEDYG
jgi:hypothetical protein